MINPWVTCRITLLTSDCDVQEHEGYRNLVLRERSTGLQGVIDREALARFLFRDWDDSRSMRLV